ncbi:hypothetical protein AA313_de0208306 [Arthrobotrys entomopaga]|nr:hypothetical protein AA313_de0208306 [Arthrobotrys entomopaga]
MSTLPPTIIALLGATGSGKSSFAKLTTGNPHITIGHDLESCTQSIATYPFRHNDTDFILVDTPGFNDTYRSDRQILDEIAEWLTTSFAAGTRLSGIIYFHRMTAVRMEGSALRNLRVFRKLCGDGALENVVLGTTFWDLVDDMQARIRESELAETPEFWGDMLKRGSRMVKISWTDRDLGLEILSGFVQKTPVTLRVQEEVSGGKKIEETAMSRALDADENVSAKKTWYQRIFPFTKKKSKMEIEMEENATNLRKVQKDNLKAIKKEEKRRISAIKAEEDSKKKVLMKQYRQQERDRRDHLNGIRLADKERHKFQRTMRHNRHKVIVKGLGIRFKNYFDNYFEGAEIIRLQTERAAEDENCPGCFCFSLACVLYILSAPVFLGIPALAFGLIFFTMESWRGLINTLVFFRYDILTPLVTQIRTRKFHRIKLAK